jgi:hypothetical protein
MKITYTNNDEQGELKCSIDGDKLTISDGEFEGIIFTKQ